MAKDVADIFTKTAVDKQVMMFSATFSTEVRKLVSKFMQNVNIIRKLILLYEKYKIDNNT